ncbi:MAG: 1-deoxy-D-xylulose-5-phosphate synthase [Bacteroidetes bacterium]|jgi:1-deoxy-D-xylulose-5-phosphate synthase|nr:1-deoxy-D-xylulose-5-phosphate synthase [Bacteroidota bacterium]
MTNTLKKINIKRLKLMNTSEIETLSDNVREFLIESNSQTGGHIGANLGTVELSLALHYVFNSPKDAIVWDTGHTGYTHKILTGRIDKFSTLNTYGGMNRFISSAESEHDFIEASHAGTSISVALGRSISLRNFGKKDWSIAVIGDGALAEGIALEALNHASVEKNVRLMIVLNDNGYAISPGFGALHEYLQSRSLGSDNPDTLFTSLGYKVIGPIDGHSITSLVSAFNEVIKSDKVCLVHIKTEKGHGLAPAASHDFKMHFSFPFDPLTGELSTSTSALGYQDIASQAIEDCMRSDPSIVAITPSTLYATGLSSVFEAFPDRCFDPGMEEQHAVSMAVGMALSGSRPILFYQSTFLQRAFDQIIHDVCFSNQDILILSVRSGFAGYDNPTHHGIYDFSYLRGVPNLQTYYPKDSHELYEMVFLALTELSGPVIIHMPYGPADNADYIRGKATLDMESPEQIHTGSDGVIITIGNKVEECKLAIDSLSKKGLSFGLVNVRKLKPLPDDQLIKIIGDLGKVVTVEESVLEGGFGSAVSSMLHQHSMSNELLQIGLPCSFIEGGSNEELSSIYGVNSEGIVKQILKRWKIDCE